MKSILMSYQPYWYYHIFIAKDKKIEVRKSNLEPHRNFAYCSKNKKSFNRIQFRNESEREQMLAVIGKVGGEFECQNISEYDSAWSAWAYAVAPYGSLMPMSENSAFRLMGNEALMTSDDIEKYFGDEDFKAYFLHITALKIYDKPKELGEFRKPQKCVRPCERFVENVCRSRIDCCFPQRITRPPQSWQYVETPDWAEEDTI